MRKLLLSAAVLLFGPSSAWAYCPAFPDGPASHNVQNGTFLALCQQQELAAANERMRQEREIKAMLQNLELKQQELRQAIPPLLPVF